MKERMRELVDKLNKYAHEYYVLDNPTVEDSEYDELMRRIKKLEADFPSFVTEESPTQKVGGYALNTFEKVMGLFFHITPNHINIIMSAYHSF